MAWQRTKSARVLDYIRRSGQVGRSFREIQRFVVEMNGRKWESEIQHRTVWDKALKKPIMQDVVLSPAFRFRGYWVKQLCGSFTRNGILDKFCLKLGGPLERANYVFNAFYANGYYVSVDGQHVLKATRKITPKWAAHDDLFREKRIKAKEDYARFLANYSR